MVFSVFFWVDERYTPVKRGGPPVFFGSMGARADASAGAVHLFFFRLGGPQGPCGATTSAPPASRPTTTKRVRV
jgi:hypothetical protein